MLIVAALMSVTPAIAGCGGSAGPGVAHVSTAEDSPSTNSESGDSPAESTANPQRAGLAYARCMRSSGVPNFPDPTGGGGFLFHTSAGIDPSSPAFKAAQAKCHTLLPGGGLPGGPSSEPPSARTLARFLNIARCMRQHGVYDFPDPRTSVPANPFGSGGAGVISDIEEVILIFPGTINEQAPIFTRAAATCAFPLHNH